MITKNEGFHKVQIKSSSANKDGHNILYVKEGTVMFRKQVKFHKRDDIMHRWKQRIKFSISVSPRMATDYI